MNIINLNYNIMTIQDLQNLDLYKCSLQDINKSFKGLGRHLQMMIKEGKANSNRFQELKKLHVLISRARKGMTADGFMMTYNTDIDRLPNSKSVL